MIAIKSQPQISVGVVSGVSHLDVSIEGPYAISGGGTIGPGSYRILATHRGVILDGNGKQITTQGRLRLTPTDPDSQSFSVKSVQIGIGFHWQRHEDQRFAGVLEVMPSQDGTLIFINTIGIEEYLVSVISSEMSATSDPELLKAHAITSRSWLLAQLADWKVDRSTEKSQNSPSDGHLIRWYDRENHEFFDVCADDHCQRYQGVTKATTAAVRAAIDSTYGQVLTSNGEICDARFSKSCGGMTEDYRAAWQDVEVSYLAARPDWSSVPEPSSLPLNDEMKAQAWILGNPPAYCNATDGRLLAKILPGFDQETVDFYRWERQIGQDELQGLLRTKVGLELGSIRSMRALERGHSGRIIKLLIEGERDSFVVGKELEIRRALSESHLYSSAFVVTAKTTDGGVPESFHLKGAGWGHGVGLCQIGAAAMAEGGLSAEHILLHYFLNAELEQLYPR